MLLSSPRVRLACVETLASRIRLTHPANQMRIRQTISGGIFAQTNDSEIGSEVVRIEYYWVDLHAINETRVLFLLLLFFCELNDQCEVILYMLLLYIR